MKIKIINLILFIIIAGILLNGYLHEQDIDDLAYIIAIGLDKGENKKILLSVQISIPSDKESGKSSKNEDSSNKSKDTLIQSVECNSISSGLDEINNIISKRLNLSHCKLIVFSDKIAQDGILEYINTLENNLELRANSHVIVSTVAANEFLSISSPTFENSTEKYYEIITSTSRSTGYSINATLNDIYTSLDDSLKESCCILGSKIIDNDESNIVISGIAVFKGDKLVGTLNSNETIPYLLITNTLKECIISVPNPFKEDNDLDIHISDFSHVKTEVSLNNFFVPHIITSANLDAIILSTNYNFNTSSQSDLSQIEDSVSKYLSDLIVNYYKKTCQEYNSDIAGIGKYAVHNFLTINDWLNYNWLDRYKNSTFEASIKVNIQSSYFIS